MPRLEMFGRVVLRFNKLKPFPAAAKLGADMAATKRSVEPPLRAFIQSNFSASWEIDLLTALAWPPKPECALNELCEALGVERGAVLTCLDKLVQRGLISCSGDKYAYAPDSTEKRVLCDQMLQTYAQSRLTVIRMLYE